MKKKNSSFISVRKAPKQTRSMHLVANILEAATRILLQEGVHCFTTSRIAEKAGVSIGSLYQYFPNKQAILFSLQENEWKQTQQDLANILFDFTIPPLQRLRLAIKKFFHTECEEAVLRKALSDAAPFFRDSSETAQQEQKTMLLILRFINETIPNIADEHRYFISKLLLETVLSIGERLASHTNSFEEVDKWAEAVSDMLCYYIENNISNDSNNKLR
ncbi:TetR family transcriptional regulator [Photorhabdus asymbiotica]|uniref:TetR family transcriptional regulator n=1 Tax=Photorhabdus asymbiotica TaxID=291112 RepID=UPI003DA6FDF1